MALDAATPWRIYFLLFLQKVIYFMFDFLIHILLIKDLF